MATGGVTRADYEAKAHEAVMRWAAALGLEGGWKFKTVLADRDREDGLENRTACVELRYMHRHAIVTFQERLKPELYENNAAHEVLHVLFAPVERAIAELAEPAKTLMDDAMHAAIERLACVLSGKATPLDNDQELGERVPWEAERGG